MWTEHTTDDWRRRTTLVPFEAWKRRVFALRARMLSFVQNMTAFLSHEVLEPNWQNLEDKLSRVTTVDQMLNDHVDFLDTCLKESGLTKAELIAVGPPSPFSFLPTPIFLTFFFSFLSGLWTNERTNELGDCENYCADPKLLPPRQSPLGLRPPCD